jgi:hypothetical protein
VSIQFPEPDDPWWQRVLAAMAWLVPVGILLAVLAVIGLAGAMSDPDYYGPRTGWTHLGDSLLYRCEGRTAIYRQDPAGSFASVVNDPRCAAAAHDHAADMLGGRREES